MPGNVSLPGGEQGPTYPSGTFADSKLCAKGLARGREGTEHETIVNLLNLRREMSTRVSHYAQKLSKLALLKICH